MWFISPIFLFLPGSLKIIHDEEEIPPKQDHGEQDWSPSWDQEDPEPPQIKEERVVWSDPEEESENTCVPPLHSEKRAYYQPHSFHLSQDQMFRHRPYYTSKETTTHPNGEGYKLSGLVIDSQPIFSMNPDRSATHSEYSENAEGVENGEWLNTLVLRGTKKRQQSKICPEGIETSRVETHMNNPAKERRHTCPVCRKRFKESSHLRDHLRIHTGEKPFQCKECGMNFRQSGALTLHMRTHTGEKPYQCSECGRRFNRKGDMETHRVTHTGERPHQCMECGKSFRRKSNLNTHVKTHAEEKAAHTEPLWAYIEICRLDDKLHKELGGPRECYTLIIRIVYNLLYTHDTFSSMALDYFIQETAAQHFPNVLKCIIFT